MGAVFWLTAVLVALPSTEAMTGPEVVAAATEAAGGETWRRPRTLRLSGTMTTYPGGLRAAAVEVDDYRMWRAFPDASGTAQAANGKVRFDARADGEVVFQIAYDGEGTWNQDGLVEAETAGEEWAANFGFGIIRFADDLEVRRMADADVEGHDCLFVEVVDEAGKGTLFGVDADDLAIRYVGFDTPRGWHHRTYDAFYDVTAEGGGRFRQPGRVRLFYDGRLTNDVEWTGAAVNAPLPDGVFVAPLQH